MNFLMDWYFWTKSLHVISVIAWMAGLFYLPRLYVYHVEEAAKGPALIDTLVVMERRLLKAIMNPAMVAVWVFGLVLAWQGNWWMAPWFHAKFALVLLLTGYQGWLSAEYKPGEQGTEAGLGWLAEWRGR